MLVLVLLVCCSVVLAAVSVEMFDWGRYLGDGDVTGAPVSCFKHVGAHTHAQTDTLFDLFILTQLTYCVTECVNSYLLIWTDTHAQYKLVFCGISVIVSLLFRYQWGSRGAISLKAFGLKSQTRTAVCPWRFTGLQASLKWRVHTQHSSTATNLENVWYSI